MMQIYSYEMTVGKQGTVILSNLPFNTGDRIAVILIPRPEPESEKRYPLHGVPVAFLDPTAPVAEEDWEVLQ